MAYNYLRISYLIVIEAEFKTKFASKVDIFGV